MSVLTSESPMKRISMVLRGMENRTPHNAAPVTPTQQSSQTWNEESPQRVDSDISISSDLVLQDYIDHSQLINEVAEQDDIDVGEVEAGYVTADDELPPSQMPLHQQQQHSDTPTPEPQHEIKLSQCQEQLQQSEEELNNQKYPTKTAEQQPSSPTTPVLSSQKANQQQPQLPNPETYDSTSKLSNLSDPKEPLAASSRHETHEAVDLNKLMEMIGDITESTKSITIKTDLIPNLQTEISALSTEMKGIKADLTEKVADLSARVLVNEQSIKSLQDDVKNEKSYVKSHVRPIVKKLENGLLDCLSKETVQKINHNEKAIAELKATLNTTKESLEKTANYNLSELDIQSIGDYILTLENAESSTTSSLKSSLSKAEETIASLKHAEKETGGRIRSLEEKLEKISNAHININNKATGSQNNNNNNSQRKSQVNNRNAPAANETLEADTIIIGDSNTKKLDMASLGRGTRKRYTCYTIPHITNFLRTATIKKQPKKVLIHVGTNDVEQEDDEEKLKRGFSELIKLLRKEFPSARIIFSSIFVRREKEDPLNDMIQILNHDLEQFCDITPLFTYMDNSDITHRDMADTKHVNPTGLHAFLCNIWKVVFGEQYRPSRRRR